MTTKTASLESVATTTVIGSVTKRSTPQTIAALMVKAINSARHSCSMEGWPLI